MAPDDATELGLGEDLRRLARERREQLELGAAELDGAAVDVGAAGRCVDVQLSDVQVPGRGVFEGAAGDRLDDGSQDEVAAVAVDVVVAAGPVGAQRAESSVAPIVMAGWAGCTRVCSRPARRARSSIGASGARSRSASRSTSMACVQSLAVVAVALAASKTSWPSASS